MKNKLLVLLFILSGTMLSAQETYLNNVRQKWANAKAYTIEVAQLMPADAYDFQPTPEQKSFKGQLLHTMNNMVWLSSTHFSAGEYEKDLEDESYNKEEMIELLDFTFDYVAKALEQIQAEDLESPAPFFTNEVTNKWQILTLLNDHLTHHRGQLLVYLRLKGVQPPRYRGW
jgi:uncharacterized damage-inducible protein DinB